MKASFFHFLSTSLVLVNAHATSTSASPPIYILAPTTPDLDFAVEVNRVASALDRLGYTHSHSPGLDHGTYAILVHAAYRDRWCIDPEAKFILPVSTSVSWTFDEADGLESASSLLVLDVHSRDEAQTWVVLCDFLGLGYSVVERLRLWRFP